MHVVWAPSWYPTPDQPLNGSFFAEQVHMLRDGGLDVGVVVLDPHSFWQGRPGPVELDLAERVVRRSVPVLPKGVFPGDAALIKHYAKPLADEYEKNFGRPDLIHAHSVFPGILLARALAEFWDVPFGLTEHRPSSLERNRLSPRFRVINKTVAATGFRLTVSAGMAEKATHFYGMPFEVLPLPVLPIFAEVEPDRQDGDFVFAHLSMCDRNKRPEETVEAFSYAHQVYPHTRLIIGGGNSERINQIQEAAHRCGVADVVTCIGEISRSDVPQFMANADCHVLFSAQEAAGVVYSEAHTAGTPSIGSATNGGLFQITKDTGTIVPVDDIQALANAMVKMIEDKASGLYARGNVREAALNVADSEVYIRKTKAIYSAAIAEF